jgi:hypothetical protein
MKLRAPCFMLAVIWALSGTCVAQTPVGTCALSQEEKIANAKLTFDQFDQKGVTPSTWRQLSDQKCQLQAVEAAEDYLIHAHLENEAERRDVGFHIGQSLAMVGKYEEASLMVASSKDPMQHANAELDWNTYLDGTWAFLKRNKAELESNRTRLAAEPGRGNALNATVLTGLLNCFAQPYSIAYEKICRDGKYIPK